MGKRAEGKKHRERDTVHDLRNGSTPTKHQAEALELLAAMRQDLEVIAEYLDDELRSAMNGRMSSKSVARVRLVSDDLRSARRFTVRKARSGS